MFCTALAVESVSKTRLGKRTVRKRSQKRTPLDFRAWVFERERERKLMSVVEVVGGSVFVCIVACRLWGFSYLQLSTGERSFPQEVAYM